MANAVFGMPIRDVNGGSQALAATNSYIAVSQGAMSVSLYCDADFRLALAPRLKNVQLYEASGGTYTDYTSQATDASASTHVPLDAMAATSILYIGCDDTFIGCHFDIGDNANAETAALDVEYYTGTAWADVESDSDGTDSGGATLAVDGEYTWTLPAMVATTVNNQGLLYYIRFKPSAPLSATVDINEIKPMYKTTGLGYFQGGVEYHFSVNRERVGHLQAKVASGTPTLYYTWFGS